MKLCTGIFFFFFVTFGTTAAELTVDGVEFAYRLPAGQPQAIMVLFGGRNWKGADTLKRFRFDDLADRHRLILLSPSFRDRNYWEPEKWSGPALQRAAAELERRYRMPSRPLFFYGYSAGGQCASLFYAWMPEKVAAWAAHACGVYPQKITRAHAPALITCGIEDTDRYRISRSFICRYARPMENCSGNPFPAAMNSIQKLSNLPEPGSMRCFPEPPHSSTVKMTPCRSSRISISNSAIRFIHLKFVNCGSNDGIHL